MDITTGSQIMGPQLQRQGAFLQAEMEACLKKTLAAGSFILGEQLQEFEEAFARYCQTKFAVGVGSGTDALHLTLLALGIGPGNEVITVANTAPGTVIAILLAGATAVLVDISPASYTMDPSALEKGLSAMTKAIIPVHLFGLACDMDPILELAGRHRLRVVEDACQAHGSMYRGKKTGAIGHAGCFSFYPTKNLGAFGDGGMITTDDPELSVRLKRLRNYGKGSDGQCQEFGINSRLDDIQASFLVTKLAYLDGWNLRRADIADRYARLLRLSQATLPTCAAWARHAWHLYVVRHPQRDALKQYMQEHGIATQIHYAVPLHRHPGLHQRIRVANPLTETERAAGEILSLPICPFQRDDEIDRIAATIIDFENRQR